MFLSKKVEDQLILILDIQSTLVGGSLVVISPQNPPRIIFSYSSNIAYDPGVDNSKLIKATLTSIKDVVNTATVALHARRKVNGLPVVPAKISSVDYVLSSPWIISEAKVMKMGFEKEKIITPKFIADLIGDNRSKITVLNDEPLDIIEQKIFDVRLNGYSVDEWQNKTTRALEVYFTVSVAGTKMIEYFINEVRPLVHHSRVHFHSSLLLQYITVEKVLNLGFNYCLIHSHGDYTDIFIVREKFCVYFGSYPIGIRTVLGKIESKTKNNRQAVESLLSMYDGGKLEDSHSKKTRAIVESVIGEWVSGLKSLLSESKVEIEPSLSLVLNTMFYDECFVKILQKLNPDAHASLLSIDDLSMHVTFEEHVEKRRITALESIAIHSLLV